MTILKVLLEKGYIDLDINESSFDNCKVQCPFCGANYNLEDGIYNCTTCNKTFRKIGPKTYDSDKVTNSAADYLIQLLTYCAKADTKISSQERDYILNYIESFDKNKDQESWAFAQYDLARHNNYSKNVIILLKKSISQLIDKYYLELDILFDILNIFFIDNNNLNENQEEIIKDYLDIFKISPKICEEKIQEILSNKNTSQNKETSTNENEIDEWYKVLGLKKGCSENEFKKRYAYLAKNYHPDKFNSQNVPTEIKKEMEDKYKKINNAYDKLKNIF